MERRAAAAALHVLAPAAGLPPALHRTQVSARRGHVLQRPARIPHGCHGTLRRVWSTCSEVMDIMLATLNFVYPHDSMVATVNALRGRIIRR